MLQSIRDQTQGWIAGVIISLVILSFALWGIHSYMVGAASTTAVAKVNGVEISKSQVSSTYERLRRQAQTNLGSMNIPLDVESELRARALQTLINMQVLEQASIASKYTVSSAQVEGFLENMPEFQVNGQFSLQRFQQALSAAGLSAGEFLNLIRSTLLIDQPRLGIMLSSFALPNEISQTMGLINQERDVQYMTLPTANMLKQHITISADEIQAYYQQHQNEFKTPEQVSVDYLQLSLPQLMASIQPTEEALKTFYNDNQNSYTLPAQVEVQKVLLPLAEKASDKEATAAQIKAMEIIDKTLKGGDVAAIAKQNGATVDVNAPTWISIDTLAAELQKPVAALTKPGQWTDPIKTAKGLYIVRLIAKKDPVVQPYDQVKDKVKAGLVRQQAEEKYADARDKLANQTYETPDSLEPAAKALGLTIQSTGLFTKAKGSNDISANDKVREAAFTADVLNAQNNSDAIQISPDTTVVLRVKSHIPASLLPLATVQAQIENTLKAKKAEANTASLADQIKQELASGKKTPDEIAAAYNNTWNKLGYIGRYSTKADSSIVFTAFKMPAPAKANDMSYATAKVPSGYAVIGLAEIRDGSASTAQNAETYNDQVQNSEATIEYALFIQSQKDNAKIESFQDKQQPDA